MSALEEQSAGEFTGAANPTKATAYRARCESDTGRQSESPDTGLSVKVAWGLVLEASPGAVAADVPTQQTFRWTLSGIEVSQAGCTLRNTTTGEEWPSLSSGELGVSVTVSSTQGAHRFELSCEDAEGREASASLVVQVKPSEPTGLLGSVLDGGGVQLTWLVSENASSCAVKKGGEAFPQAPMEPLEASEEGGMKRGEAVISSDVGQPVAYMVQCESDPGVVGPPSADEDSVVVWWGDDDVTAGELSQLADVELVVGNIDLRATTGGVADADLNALSALQEVSGSLSLDSDNVNRLSNPATGAGLVSLRRVLGDLKIELCANLLQAALPELTTVGGDLTVEENRPQSGGLPLNVVDMRSLRSVGENGGSFILKHTALEHFTSNVAQGYAPFGNLSAVGRGDPCEEFTVQKNPGISCEEVRERYCNGLNPRPGTYTNSGNEGTCDASC